MNLLEKSMSIINILCSSYYKDTILKYKGFIKEKNNIYLFFDCSHMIIDTIKLTEYNDLWLVIIDEIINYKSVCGFPINENVFNLFYNYEKLTYLENKYKEHYQLPIIGYSTCELKKIDFVATFGIQINNGKLGNYYYFTDYENSIKNNYLKYGLIRCVIFTDKTKLIFDDNVNSIEKELTNWNDNLHLLFDSVIYIKSTDNDREFLWVIKNYNQYSVLSVHIKSN
jgi:hypothetical protein